MKELLKKNFSTLYFFYQYIGKKIYAIFGFNMLMVFMDGVGLALFIPLLSIAENGSTIDESDKIGFYVKQFFNFFDVPINIGNMLFLIILIFILKGVFYYYATKFNAVSLQTVMLKMRTVLGNSIKNLSYKEYIATDVGRMQNSLMAEINLVINGCVQYLDAIKNILFVSIYLGFAFFIDWRFSLLVMIGGGLTNWIYKYFYKRTQNLSRAITKNNHRYGGIVVEVINHFKYFKATGRSNFFFGRLQSELDTLYDNNVKVSKLNAKLGAIREPITIGVICIVIFFHVTVFNSPLSGVLLILLFFYRVMQKIIDIQNNWNNYLANTGAIENIIDFQGYLDRNSDNFYFGNSDLDEINVIELKQLSVVYGESVVLNNLSLKILKNESIAFVGESGSGKTTLVNVLSALLPFDKGHFEVNGKDIKAYDIQSYKSKVGYISQEATVFNADIFDNITFWDKRTADNLKKFNEVIDMCALRPFLENLTDRETTLLGNNGVNISGGQKQRISIAREIYRDVEVLIMDEATSALDSETEKDIKESIDKLQGKVTIISIAHRLSTVKDVDKIYLLDRGEIVAYGSFDELKLQSQYFERMTKLQGM